MAVKVLCLANDGPGGRKRGSIIHVQEGPSLDQIKLGRGCCPPTFFVLNFPDKSVKDLPSDWLEYGGHVSRILVEVDRLPSETITALAEDDRCELDLAAVTAVQKDIGPDWAKTADVAAL